MQTFLTLLKMNILMILRSKQAFFFALFMPLVIMFVFGLIGFDRPQTYDIGVVAENPQTHTREFIDQLKSFEVLSIHEGTLQDEKTALEDGDRTLVLVVPDNFIDAAGTTPQELTVYVNESQPAQASAILSILNQYLDKTSLSLAHAQSYFHVRQENIDSRDLKYIDFLLPGLLAMSVMQMAIFSVAFVFVQYKEKGVLKRLASTPLQPALFVGASAVTRLMLSFVQAALFIAVGLLMLHATVLGSYFLVALVILLGALMFLGLGFTISGIAKTVETVPALANLIAFPMMFLGGVFFPISGMPDWLQSVAAYLPLTFFSDGLREVMTRAAGLSAIGWDLVGMIVWATIFIVTATITFGFQERDSA